jgi:hypothetical protein
MTFAQQTPDVSRQANIFRERQRANDVSASEPSPLFKNL